ncbi:hypothetical protein Leryth_001949 [Lithospermum erythrorhizon]|nr:hypothetical protein Leryth_001949 [Lithospermum erythrorhizon]
MGSRLGRRVVHFANLPIKLLMPSSFSNITEIALKTIPSASKIEIKRVLESLYGFEVEEVRTLNMDGKKKKRGGLLIAKPDYKKAYVTLKHPLSISPDLYPIPTIQEEKRLQAKQSKSKTGTVEDEQSEGWKKSHWLDEKREVKNTVDRRNRTHDEGRRDSRRGGGGGERAPQVGGAKFPWSNMRTLYSR